MTSPETAHVETVEGLRSLRVLARLLDYPTADLQAAADELAAILHGEARLQPRLRQRFADWCRSSEGPGYNDARQISRDTLQDYANHLRGEVAQGRLAIDSTVTGAPKSTK